MRRRLFLIGVAIMSGCGLDERRTSQSAPQSTEALLEKTLRDMQADLKSLQSDFPQLTEIDRAEITTNPAGKNFRLDYRKGFVKDDRINGPTFESGGGEVFVEMQYPALKEDANHRPIFGRAIPLDGGRFIALWTLVRAEQTASGERFIQVATRVIESRIQAMERELGTH